MKNQKYENKITYNNQNFKNQKQTKKSYSLIFQIQNLLIYIYWYNRIEIGTLMTQQQQQQKTHIKKYEK